LKTSTYAIVLLTVALFSGAAGWLLARLSTESEVERLEAEAVARERRVLELEDRLQAWESRSEPPAEPPSAAEAPSLRRTDPAPALADEAESGGPLDDAAALTPARRAARTAELRASFDGWFARGEGEEALEALKELAALVPEGREAAMELAVRINQDVQGEGRLKLSQMVFYTSLGDPAVVALFGWSLENPSPPDFRQMAVYGLPWTQPQEKTLSTFLRLLREDRDQGVQRALVWNLSQMRRPEAEKALAELVRDPSRDAIVRTQALTELALSTEEGIARSIEDVAYGDPDPTVRQAAKAALMMRNPPATGFMITGTLPQSQAEAAGMQAGDIIVSYAGRAVQSLSDLREAAGGATAREGVEVLVIRGGRRVPLQLRPGQMGVFGREVQAK
jgi:hypothetical protein